MRIASLLLLLALAALAGCRKSSAPPADAPAGAGAALSAAPPPAAAPAPAPARAQEPARASLSIDDFIPQGYAFMDSAHGDLDRDQFSDIVLILKVQDEGDISEGHPAYDEAAMGPLRPTLLLLGQGDNGYRLAARNDRAALCGTCGGAFGDPHAGIAIKNGYFSLEHYGGSAWRWTRTITFKYDADKGGWFLHKDGGGSFNVLTLEENPEEVKTTKDFGTVTFEAFDAYR